MCRRCSATPGVECAVLSYVRCLSYREKYREQHSSATYGTGGSSPRAQPGVPRQLWDLDMRVRREVSLIL